MYFNYKILENAPQRRYMQYKKACQRNMPYKVRAFKKAKMIISSIDLMRKKKTLITESEIDLYYQCKAYVEKYINSNGIIVKD